jgi:hypothetical protein
VATIPSFERTSGLVARGLGLTPAELLASFREAGPDDIAAIVALRESVSGKQVRWNDTEYLAWRYGLGTSRRAYAKYRILSYKGQAIAGIGAEEFTLRSPAGNIAAACPMDILSLPEYRNLGLGPWLNQALFQKYPLVVALGANSNSIGLVSRLYSLLPGRRDFQFPLNLSTYLKKRVRNPLLYALLSPIAMVTVRTRGAWVTRRFPKHRDRIRHIARFDDSLDAALAKDTRKDEISILRSADYLNWRYCDNPRASYQLLEMRHGSDVDGYVVYRKESPANDVRHVDVSDWWLAPSAPADTLSALIGALLADTHAFWPAYVATATLGESLHGQLRKAGFIGRSGEHNATGYHCERQELLAAIQPVGRWKLTDLGDDVDGVV